MNAGDLHAYAAQQVADARRTIATHRTEAYTGVCRSCGRRPCDEQRAARTRLAHHNGTLNALRARARRRQRRKRTSSRLAQYAVGTSATQMTKPSGTNRGGSTVA
ncbi:hypothetical protein, partial [Micromonospora sp. 4G55]|uniref:hypothetical protein n=1 Tax=Micromonospora sp. 4G55 TaxID=2806102 RepID=UPI001A48655C